MTNDTVHVIVQVGLSIESSGAVKASQPLCAKVGPHMKVILSLVAIGLGTAMERADEANNSLGAVNTLQMKFEITIPSVRCMGA